MADSRQVGELVLSTLSRHTASSEAVILKWRKRPVPGLRVS
jgi:hypothetical protein